MALAAGDTGIPGCTSVSAVLTIEPSLRRSTDAISTMASFVASRPVVSMSKQRMIIRRWAVRRYSIPFLRRSSSNAIRSSSEYV